MNPHSMSILRIHDRIRVPMPVPRRVPMPVPRRVPMPVPRRLEACSEACSRLVRDVGLFG